MKKNIYLLTIFFSCSFFSQNLTVDWLYKPNKSITSIATDNQDNIIFTTSSYKTYNDYVNNKPISTIGKLNLKGELIWSNEIKLIKNLKIETASDGSIFLIGTFKGSVDFNPNNSETYNVDSNSTDAFLLKLDKNGNFIWVRVFSSNKDVKFGDFDVSNNFIFLTDNPEEPLDVDPSAIRELLVSGHFILKLNLNGEFQALREIKNQDNFTFDIVVDPDENCYLYGATYEYSTCYTRVCGQYGSSFISGTKNNISKYEFNKNLNNDNWYLKGIGRTGWPFGATGAIELNDNGLIIVNQSFGVNFTQKISYEGNPKWKYNDSDFNDSGLSKFVLQDKLNNIYTIGEYINNGFFIRKNDFEGNLIWNHLSGTGLEYETSPFFPENYTSVTGAAIDNQGNIIYSGRAITNDDLDPSAKTYNLSSNGAFICKLKEDNSLSLTKANNISFRIFPNPTTDILQIESSIENKIQSIRVINVNGKLITNILNPGSSIDLSSLSKGIYFVKIIAKQGVSQTKIVKK